MDRLERLSEKVHALYESKRPERAEWADWLYANHVFAVATKAGEVAASLGADGELAQVAGMLHDIADAVMSRENPNHAAGSAKLATDMMREAGFTDSEIKIVVEDAMALHGCHDGRLPQTPEGRALATADGAIHLTTDFYDYAWEMSQADHESTQEFKDWALPKIERDYRTKILIDEVRREVAGAYERRKAAIAFLS